MKRCRPAAEDYTVGWVCALPIELAAATEMLDEEHQDVPHDANDTNIYTLGRIGEHSVVIACLPAGQSGANSAATVATQMKSKFVSIRFGLMVGIGGGVANANSDIRLGDVVISQPSLQYGGVVQYDFGKTGIGGQFTRTGFLNAPPTVLLTALSKLRANHVRRKSKLSGYLSAVSHLPEFAYSKAGPDILFESTYNHIDGSTCARCNKDRSVERTPRGTQEIAVHYGTIASGNQVMKDGVTRDRVSSELGGILCFEMEAAGLMVNFPCLVIRGICDYADSHKNKSWQPYAAATAAACAKELLSVIPSAEVAKTPTVQEAIGAKKGQSGSLEHIEALRENAGETRNTRHNTQQSGGTLARYYSTLPSGESSPLIGNRQYLRRIHDHLDSLGWQNLVVIGQAGVGKSACLAATARNCGSKCSVFWFSASNSQSLLDGFKKATEEISKSRIYAHGDLVWDPVSKFQSWLRDPAHGKWIIFLDDMTGEITYSQLMNIFPRTSLGRLVVSTKSQNYGWTLGTPLPVPTLSVCDACELFFSVYGKVRDELASTVASLVTILNCHPSGIKFASSYLFWKPDQPLEGYLNLLKKLQDLKMTGIDYGDIPPEIWLPLSITLDGLASSPAGKILELFAFLDTKRISEEFLASCRRITASNSERTVFDFMSFRQFQPAKNTLLSLALLEKKVDVNETFLTMPRYVKECVLARLRRDRTELESVAEAALLLLHSMIRPRTLQTMEVLHEVMSLHEPHCLSLSKLASSEGLQLGDELLHLGLLVALHHLGKAAISGFRVAMARYFRAWLVKNRTLTGEDQYEASLYDEATEIPARPVGILSSHETESRLRGPISSTLWKEIQQLTHVSAISRSWFTIKDEMLDIASTSARAAETRDEVSNLVDKGAHEAVHHAVGIATREYARTAERSGTVAREVLDNICGMVAHGIVVGELSPFSEDELTTIVSTAFGHDFFSLFGAVCRAWASVFDHSRQGIATMIESLAQQCVDPQDLPASVAFSIEQLSMKHIRRYVHEIVEATWEAVWAAGFWLAAQLKAAICLAMMTRSLDSHAPIVGSSVHAISSIVERCMELIVEAAEVTLPKRHRSWEWTALLRDTIQHCLKAEQAILYSGMRIDDDAMPWEQRLRLLQGDDLWGWFSRRSGN